MPPPEATAIVICKRCVTVTAVLLTVAVLCGADRIEIPCGPGLRVTGYELLGLAILLVVMLLIYEIARMIAGRNAE